MIRKANVSDIDRISEIYESIHTAEETGKFTSGWIRGIYPVRQTAVDAVKRNDMFVGEKDGIIVSAGIINQSYIPEYNNCKWEYEATDKEIMILHTLVVDPKFAKQGYASEFLDFYEKYAKENNCPCLRIDTQAKNTLARKIYKSRNYREAGIVDCNFFGIPGVHLVCLEKKI